MGGQLYRPKVDEKRIANVIEKSGDARSAYRRDLARLIHSPCFRRLQGKAQLFPSDEDDFFRNRLTHSLEVAQIATGIALNLNQSEKQLRSQPIDVDLVHFAALAHDLGHPPFGHDGERALDQIMKQHGGFEGNAQTLRILTKLEKKEIGRRAILTSGKDDIRVGLNLTYRSIASILKYDDEIPASRSKNSDVRKGYYGTEAPLINDIRSKVAPGCRVGKFKTIECSIMDLADDIAYSTYDLEDAFKAGFLSPISMAAADNLLKQKIAAVVNKKMQKEYSKAVYEHEKLTVSGVNGIILSMFEAIFMPSEELSERMSKKDFANEELSYALSAEVDAASQMLRQEGFFRSDFTSKLVYAFLSNVRFIWNDTSPPLSTVRLDVGAFQAIEVLKRFAYEALIMSHRFKMADRRGREIIDRIFKALLEKGGERLLPEDVREVYLSKADKGWRRRTICDFIASMTDRYCLEFYSRLIGINVPSIYKPY
jgi:dGTPase